MASANPPPPGKSNFLGKEKSKIFLLTIKLDISVQISFTSHFVTDGMGLRRGTETEIIRECFKRDNDEVRMRGDEMMRCRNSRRGSKG